ncbi:phospholipase D/nuclease [Delitschia confertaspora ATCC 74209]|uniref:Phospholipase D/nuclease n=1 Tax=Delitschia confertaspora ATCC 74209 TaxID=1513339 RepID=A0A9P4MU44_9PLEO|nr:phospholipase D/nuclease [Delitschia confertaspora ATCC 74209]
MSIPPQPPVPPDLPTELTTQFISSQTTFAHQNSFDDPNYYTKKPSTLITTSAVHSFTTGTGSSIYQSLSPLLTYTNHELIIVTCFWAHSPSLATLNTALRALSTKALSRPNQRKIRVRICLSSLSLWQKLLHTQHIAGQTYPPPTWAPKLGLPTPEELSGLDLQVKSIFLWPFSVMHPKFLIIDRKMVALPSANVSWEYWFEGCVTMSGAVVENFVQFYSEFWEKGSESRGVVPYSENEGLMEGGVEDILSQSTDHTLSFKKCKGMEDVKTFFLPSPHHRNPGFQPFASASNMYVPATPLNTFTLSLFAAAEKSIRIQTPNITSPPVLSALLKALERGVDVNIFTSEKLMVLEQLGTSGTTTKRCMNMLIKRYKALRSSHARTQGRDGDEEAQLPLPTTPIGNLQISFFTPLTPTPSATSPQQSHLKMTVVDDEVLILGSGNLDRASWYTSQELGVAFVDKGMCREIVRAVDDGSAGMFRGVFGGREGF